MASTTGSSKRFRVERATGIPVKGRSSLARGTLALWPAYGACLATGLRDFSYPNGTDQVAASEMPCWPANAGLCASLSKIASVRGKILTGRLCSVRCAWDTVRTLGLGGFFMKSTQLSAFLVSTNSSSPFYPCPPKMSVLPHSFTGKR